MCFLYFGIWLLGSRYAWVENMREQRIWMPLAINEFCCNLLCEDFSGFMNKQGLSAKIVHKNLGYDVEE
jgi:hypothetical protein